MGTDPRTLEALVDREYKWGFVTRVDEDAAPEGPERRHHPPDFGQEERAGVHAGVAAEGVSPLGDAGRSGGRAQVGQHQVRPIDYQEHRLLLRARNKKDGPKSLDEVDPEILRTYEKLGIPLHEQKRLAGVAVDAVFDSVSVATTFKEKLAEVGIIFCSFSEAVQNHPELVQKYLGSVVPYTDNFFASLNSAVFTDGSFVYVPKGVRCPMELSTYFRINAAETGQFERTLIIADEGAYVSYLEGCTAPIRDENQLHAAVVELIAHDNAEIKYSTVQNWYPGDKRRAKAGSTTSSPSAANALV